MQEIACRQGHMQRLLGTGRKACWESASLDTFSWKAWISVIPRVSFRLRPLVLEPQERRKQKNPQTQSCESPSKETEASTLLVLLECWGQANSDQQLLPPLNRPNSTPQYSRNLGPRFLRLINKHLSARTMKFASVLPAHHNVFAGGLDGRRSQQACFCLA